MTLRLRETLCAAEGSASELCVFVPEHDEKRGGIEAAFERKKTKYSELAAECREAGWKTTIYPVEIGCRGFVGQSTTRLLRDAGVAGGKLKKATKELAEEVEKGSFWLWLRRKDKGGERTPDPDASCRGWQGDVPVTAPPPGDVPGLKERNVDEWWFLADDPAADP
ncbi:hypothetical protein SKAU_G00196360 [Synaphobranchus kaupii]|uniref:Uncharacterized protein n=1 Tax=Synaphobranchus kaupii TaxID=118154 RepID=A0A9Q1IVP6_SYNKA|nr:hypothetical protein SKAU_G00196360 [Synaphobranchus kaupii]